MGNWMDATIYYNKKMIVFNASFAVFVNLQISLRFPNLIPIFLLGARRVIFDKILTVSRGLYVCAIVLSKPNSNFLMKKFQLHKDLASLNFNM